MIIILYAYFCMLSHQVSANDDLDVDEEIVSEGVQAMMAEQQTPTDSNNSHMSKEARAKEEKLMKFKNQLIVDSEPYKTARAACGTLAVAASDVKVIQALISEKVGETYVKLLHSMLPELVHRVLVSIMEACSVELEFDESAYAEYQQQLLQQQSGGSSGTTVAGEAVERVKATDIRITRHLIDSGVVSAIAVVTRMGDRTLGE